jgi:hypothetical protein
MKIEPLRHDFPNIDQGGYPQPADYFDVMFPVSFVRALMEVQSPLEVVGPKGCGGPFPMNSRMYRLIDPV